MPPRADHSWDDEDDGLDYEIEPPDEDVTRLAESRAKEDVAQAERAVDVDAVYRELQGRDPAQLDWDPAEFRFGIREILVATGVVALLMGMWRIGFLAPSAFAAFIAVSLVGLGAAHTYMAWRERRRREALIARQSYELARSRGELGLADMPDDDAPALGSEWEDLKASLRESLRFGVRELMVLMAFVALLMIPLRYLKAGPTAALVGLLVLGGLALQAADVDLPRWALALWWLLIFAYCLLMLGQIVAQALGFA